MWNKYLLQRITQSLLITSVTPKNNLNSNTARSCELSPEPRCVFQLGCSRFYFQSTDWRFVVYACVFSFAIVNIEPCGKPLVTCMIELEIVTVSHSSCKVLIKRSAFPLVLDV